MWWWWCIFIVLWIFLRIFCENMYQKFVWQRVFKMYKSVTFVKSNEIKTEIWINSVFHPLCRNPNLGLATKVRCGKVAGQEGDPGVTSHAPGSAKSEGMNPHTPKWTPMLGVGVPNGLPNGLPKFQNSIARVKTPHIETFLISLESCQSVDV
jgi:hypothetical protein